MRGMYALAGASVQSSFAPLPSAWIVSNGMAPGVGGRPEDRARGAVAEEDRDVTSSVREVEARRVNLAADERHAAVHPGAYPRVRHLQSVQETAALVADVERRHARQAELVAEEAAAAGEIEVRREGREDDGVDLRDVDAGAFARHLHGRDGEVARAGVVLLDEAPLFDAGPLLNPLVARVEELGEVVVGYHLARHMVADAKDRGPGHGGAPTMDDGCRYPGA